MSTTTTTTATTTTAVRPTRALVTFTDEPDRTFNIPLEMTEGDDWKRKIQENVSAVYPAAADADVTKTQTGDQIIVTITKKAGKKGDS